MAFFCNIQNSLLMSSHSEYGRTEFLNLHYLDLLLGMLEKNDEVLQIAILRLLQRLLSYSEF